MKCLVYLIVNFATLGALTVTAVYLYRIYLILKEIEK